MKTKEKIYNFLVMKEDYDLFFKTVLKIYPEIASYEKSIDGCGFKLEDMNDAYLYCEKFVFTYNLRPGWTRCSEYGDRCLTCEVGCDIIDFKKLLRSEKLKRLI